MYTIQSLFQATPLWTRILCLDRTLLSAASALRHLASRFSHLFSFTFLARISKSFRSTMKPTPPNSPSKRASRKRRSANSHMPYVYICLGLTCSTFAYSHSPSKGTVTGIALTRGRRQSANYLRPQPCMDQFSDKLADMNHQSPPPETPSHSSTPPCSPVSSVASPLAYASLSQASQPPQMADLMLIDEGEGVDGQYPASDFHPLAPRNAPEYHREQSVSSCVDLPTAKDDETPSPEISFPCQPVVKDITVSEIARGLSSLNHVHHSSSQLGEFFSGVPVLERSPEPENGVAFSSFKLEKMRREYREKLEHEFGTEFSHSREGLDKMNSYRVILGDMNNCLTCFRTAGIEGSGASDSGVRLLFHRYPL
jgi:hypothetical protein